MPITPDDPRHASLIQRVDAYLISRGFFVSEKTYHDGHMDQRVVDVLRQTFTPTALHIRASADRIAVDPSNGLAFYYDAKSGGGKDITVEALPLADHMQHGRRGVLCLYCCEKRGPRGFWAHNVPTLRQLFLPWQRTAELTKWYKEILPPCFPDTPVFPLPGEVRGSRDPFVVIDESVVLTMPSWQELIDQEIARCG